MHLRGTHCGCLSGKNQINRAQCRVKSGTASAGSGAEAEAEICAGAVSGKVHATSVEIRTARLFWNPAGTTATGNDWVSGVAGVTQQSRCWQPQHARTGLAGRKDVWADDIT